MSKTHWKNLANYDYLGAYSLTSVKEVVLTIANIKRERVTTNGGNSEDCIVAEFKENEVNGVVVKPMVFNKTNCKTVESLYGEYIEDWIGKRVTIFATETKFQREMVPCLRIRKEVPPAQIQQQTQEQHYCHICGGLVDEKIYNATMKKYGVALCSKECSEKFIETQTNEEDK